jgi:transcriptional regulator with XRE-family HTH domain
MPGEYAAKTDVPVSRSRDEIEITQDSFAPASPPKLWEDRLNHAGCGDVVSERDRANIARIALINQVREELRSERYAPRPVIVALHTARPWNAERFRQLRIGLDYSQREIATLVGVSPQAWALWESGRNRPTPTYIRRMIEIERGERTLRDVDPTTQGTIDGFVHEYTHDRYVQSISVDWDDDTNSHVPRETIRKVERVIGMEESS